MSYKILENQILQRNHIDHVLFVRTVNYEGW